MQGLSGPLLAMNMYVLYVLTRVPEYVCTVCTNKGT